MPNLAHALVAITYCLYSTAAYGAVLAKDLGPIAADHEITIDKFDPSLGTLRALLIQTFYQLETTARVSFLSDPDGIGDDGAYAHFIFRGEASLAGVEKSGEQSLGNRFLPVIGPAPSTNSFTLRDGDMNIVSFSDSLLLSSMTGSGTELLRYSGSAVAELVYTWGGEITADFDPVAVSLGNGYAYYVYDEAAAVPESDSWAFMIIGFGAVGYSLRSRRRRERVSATAA